MYSKCMPHAVTVCENRVAALYAFPRGPASIEDRRMTLDLPCRERADYTSSLLGVGQGKGRAGAVAKSFSLCENHAELFEQIDRELIQDGWARSHTAMPARIL
jgi:hypothetical protein